MKKFVKETGKKLATGALAILATIGSTSLGAFADDGATSQLPANNPKGTTSITGASTGGWTSGDELDINEGEFDQEGTIPVKAYQTSKVYNYELKVTWGNLKFVFDRGKYNPATNRLTKKLAGDSVYQYCEAGVDADGNGVPANDTTGKGVAKWCGFDGTNNRVDVENLGNGNINMIVSCAESTDTSAGNPAQAGTENVDMQVGFITSEAENGGATDENWIFSASDSANYTPATMRTGDGDTTAEMRFGKDSNTAASAIIQKKFNLDGTVAAEQDHVNSVRFYLNIKGTPTPSASTPVISGNNGQLNVAEETPSADAEWETLGNIVLNFRGVAETDTASAAASTQQP